MDFIITFFRDVLDGPLYIIVAIICGILICSCIGYLGEQYLNKKKEKEEYDSSHAAIATDNAVVSEMPTTVVTANSVGPTTVTAPLDPVVNVSPVFPGSPAVVSPSDDGNSNSTNSLIK